MCYYQSVEHIIMTFLKGWCIMKERFKKISEKMDAYIKTKQFKWFRTLILVLGFIVTNCIAFLSGFFLNRNDNLIYKSNINAIVDGHGYGQTTQETCVTTVPQTVPVVTTPATTRIEVKSFFLESKIKGISVPDTQYTYSNTCNFENRSTVNEIRIPLTKKSFKISYDGVITAGIDSSLISVSSDNDSKIISVILPEAAIISHDIDTDSFIISDKNDNMFNPINDDDYMSICTSQNDAMEQKALDDGLFDDVYSSAENTISTILNEDKTVADYYSIRFIISKS